MRSFELDFQKIATNLWQIMTECVLNAINPIALSAEETFVVVALGGVVVLVLVGALAVGRAALPGYQE